jgi:proteasome assembly chaperone (PAC2) family protein
MFHLFIYAIFILCAIHRIQTRSIQNDTLENRIVALEKIVEKLEDRIKNEKNSSKEGLFDCLFA